MIDFDFGTSMRKGPCQWQYYCGNQKEDRMQVLKSNCLVWHRKDDCAPEWQGKGGGRHFCYDISSPISRHCLP